MINGLTKHDWLEALLFAVAVAVGLTPEMLRMIVTVNLAKGAIAMSHKKVIVKRLNTIQNFGAMDVLCTDKTGTLTQDRIILKRRTTPDGCLTVASRRKPEALESYALKSSGKVLATGRAVGERIATGKVRLIKGKRDLRGSSRGKCLSHQPRARIGSP